MKKERILNKKILLGAFAMLSLVAIVFVTSFAPFILDPAKIGTAEFWTDEIILVVIAIFSVICVMFMGQTDNAGNPKSQIAKQTSLFLGIRDKVVSSEFTQWVHQVLEPNDQKEVYARVLNEINIKQPEIVSLTRKDIKSLINMPQRIDGKWFDEITEKQYKAIIDIKNGKYNIKFVNPDYYLTDNHVGTKYTRSERAESEDNKRIGYVGLSLATKIIMVIVIGCVFGMYTRDVLANQDMSASLAKLFSRLFNVLSSSFVGYFVGCQDNDLVAGYVEMKVNTISDMLADKQKGFKAKSVEELAREKFIAKTQENTLKIEEKDSKEIASELAKNIS